MNASSSAQRTPGLLGDCLSQLLGRVPPFLALLRSIECGLYGGHVPLATPSLDLGCGDGQFAAVAFPTPFDVGLDVDPRAVAAARRSGAYRDALTGAAEVLPFADRVFMSVVANSTLEHVAGVDSALGEVQRVLRPGGRFLLTVPTHRFAQMLGIPRALRSMGCTQAALAYGAWFNRISAHRHADAPEVWLRRIQAHGLCVASWRYYGSAGEHLTFDLAHYLSAPCLLIRALCGRWVLWPGLHRALFHAWFRRVACLPPDAEGPYAFFDAVKS